MKYAIFSSVGNNDKFLPFCLNNKCCDLFVNFYGSDDKIYSSLKTYSQSVSKIKTTKFPALKYMYENSKLCEYDYVFVLDDDCTIEYGELCNIPVAMQKYNIDIASACHSIKGKISHGIMKHHQGEHIFRYVNFVEMNFPIFSSASLKKYMSIYDGKLCGWGNDWWYLQTINSKNKNCAIFDNVCVINPYRHQKDSVSIDNFMSREDRCSEWRQTQKDLNLREWGHRNLEFIYE